MSKLPLHTRIANLAARATRALSLTATNVLGRTPVSPQDALTRAAVIKVPFFSKLDASAITDVASTLRRIDVPGQSLLIRKGDSGDCMYFIADGEVEIELPGDKRIYLGTGAFFGEMALIDHRPRSANVTTTRASTLLILALVDFRALMARHPNLADIVTAEAKRRTQQNA